MTPDTSSPGMSLAPGGGGYDPSRCIKSGRLTPAPATRISTSRGPGFGTGRSTGIRTSGPPGLAISIEVSIEAPSLTKAEVQKALNGRTAPYVDGVTVQRLRIWCKDGLLEPGGLKLPVPPPHPNTPKVDAESDKDLAPTG